ARAAGVPFEIGAGTLRPVTITLTNVRLTTALDAVCDNASCAWRLDGALKVTPVAAGRRASLPPRVSFDVKDSPGAEVFRAMGAAIGVTVTVSPGTASPEQTLSLSFHNAATTDVLNMMCEALRCEWSFDAENGLRIAPKKR
ncbi:MAG TPA: hypothetical protein VN628_02925, partial [Vicinamibacterales bacterium]|nr:hypothetical protein [Vicinamibacterales bacterium]